MAAEWPVWELQGYGSAAPTPEPACLDDPVGDRGPGVLPARLDPLGPWFSARLTFADGARVDVLVAVFNDRIAVEDVRADPPLTLDGLAALARWIDGPLDDACRTATGRPRKARPGAEAKPLVNPWQARSEAEPPVRLEGGAPRPQGPAIAAPSGSVVHGEGPLCATGGADAAEATGAVGRADAAGLTGAAGASADRDGFGARDGIGADDRGGAVLDAPTHAPTDTPAHFAAEAETEGSGVQGAVRSGTPEVTDPLASNGSASGPVPVADAAPEQGAEPASDTCLTSCGPAPEAPSDPNASPALLARSRASERRRLAADAYREAQRQGRDPVEAVMHATGRNRRRSLRLIAGARDEGFLTPRHKR
ncbi:DUF6214 family protein [Streptomyces sp. NPDC017993]|uniref:DUF6214 family protein n=1 Tax=Streptomyces sp. NPDC017993 TaxID=3365027 RepID=UPI0037B2ECD1